MPALTREELDLFENEGYVVVKDVIDPTKTLDPVIAEYATVLDRLADELYQRPWPAARASRPSTACATPSARDLFPVRQSSTAC